MTRSKFIQTLSIKNKIVAIILLVTYLMVSIGFAFVAIWDLNRLRTDIQSNLLLNAKLISNYCVVPLTFGDKQQATEALSNFEYIQSVEIACLYDQQGNLFATYPDTLSEDSFIELNQQTKIILNEKYFYIQKPVLFQNELYGTLDIKANSKQLSEVRRNFILTISLATLILMIFSTIIASRMQRLISAPILTLNSHINKISKNQDYSARIKKRNNDEIGSLYDGFNILLGQIQKSSKERDLNLEKLQQSTEKLNLALSGGKTGIWEWNSKSDVMIWDARMESMFGLEIGKFKQNYKAFKGLLHPDDIVPIEKAIKEALDNIKPYNAIYRVVWEKGEIRYINAQALVSKDEDGNPTLMTGVCVDITEIKKAEEEIQELNTQLEQKVAERTIELELKYAEVEKLNHVFVGREIRMVELKKEIAKLKDAIEGN